MRSQGQACEPPRVVVVTNATLSERWPSKMSSRYEKPSALIRSSASATDAAGRCSVHMHGIPRRSLQPVRPLLLAGLQEPKDLDHHRVR